MRRHEALAELSRDHHQALACALVLKRATEETSTAAASSFLAFWHEHGRSHFRAEEEVLLPAFARHQHPRGEAVVRVLTEHMEIRRDAQRIERGVSDPVFLNDLGRRLEAHVRHEERTLFPMVEQRLADSELVELARSLASAESEMARRASGEPPGDELRR
jgi:iron-sulfur cluster repair protein YtfE (RIC family)